ncbi:MAG: zinc metallopeptidase [Clostridiaceae bacterium]|nr:zinc metallopeptidase [Clostridiaceae bacterium]
MIYLILMIVTMIFGLIAQASVRRTFKKYNTVPTKSGLTGEQAARKIIQMNNLDVRVEGTHGELTDHYDPRNNTLRLSESTMHNNSIAAIGVAAHEAGHAIQDGVNYFPNKLRAALVPVANIGSRSGPYLAFIGIMINAYASRGNFGITVAYIGLFLYLFAVLFYFVTLPVEFNASNRAITILNDTDMLDAGELKGAKKVLRAAAMTYVASAASALVSLLRLVSIVNNSNRR